eukprot:c13115_g1_i1 orf=600-971(+)
MYSSFREHGIILNFRLPQGRAVVCNDDELALSATQGFQGGLVSQGELATLHDKSKPVVDALLGLFCFLSGHHGSVPEQKRSRPLELWRWRSAENLNNQCSLLFIRARVLKVSLLIYERESERE